MCCIHSTYIPHVYHTCATHTTCGAHIVHVLHAQYVCVAYTPYVCYLCCITTWVVHTCYTYATCVLHAYYHAALLHSKYGQSRGHNIEKNLDRQYSTVFHVHKQQDRYNEASWKSAGSSAVASGGRRGRQATPWILSWCPHRCSSASVNNASGGTLRVSELFCA